jgi:CHASE3 domain sensor protein
LTWRFGVFVLLLTLISVAVSIKSSLNTNQNTQCLARYAERSAAVQQARADATKAKDDARDALLDGVTALLNRPPTNPAKAQAKLHRLAADYQTSKAALEATRNTNPLPDFPRECGNANDSPAVPQS